MTDDKKKTNEEGITFEDIADKLSFAGQPLHFDPDTGNLRTRDFTDEQREQLRDLFMQAYEGGRIIRDSASKIKETATNVANAIFSDKTRELLQAMREDFKPIFDLMDEMEELQPYIDAEMEKPEYNGITFDDILKDHTARELLDELQDYDSQLYKIFDVARAAKKADIIDIESYRAEKLNLPVDRFNFLAWDDFKETGGQIKFNMMAERDRNDPDRNDLDISMRYSLTFGDDPNIRTTKELNHYDRRLTQAIDTLWTSGKDIIMLSEIFYNMGGTGKVGDAQTKKINDSLTKQGTARVYINNHAEAQQYDYPEIVYDGNILNFERISVKYKGQVREAIKILRRPVLMEFADQRDQLTVVPMKTLQSKISKTDKHLRIEDYILYRIARQKNEIARLQIKQEGKYVRDRQKKINNLRKLSIMLPTFYEKTGNANKKAIERQRALDTAKRYMDHYKSEAGGCYIDDYKVEADRITITLPIK